MNDTLRARRITLGLPPHPPRRSFRAWLRHLERRRPLAYAFVLISTLDAALIAAFFVMGALPA